MMAVSSIGLPISVRGFGYRTSNITSQQSTKHSQTVAERSQSQLIFLPAKVQPHSLVTVSLKATVEVVDGCVVETLTTRYFAMDELCSRKSFLGVVMQILILIRISSFSVYATIGPSQLNQSNKLLGLIILHASDHFRPSRAIAFSHAVYMHPYIGRSFT
jgi:hypothetical protein